VFFALIASRFGIPLDRIAAGLISLFVVKAGWDLLSNSMRVLLDASVDQSVINTVRSILHSEPAVVTVESVTGRNSGRYVFVEATITLRIDALEKAHDLSDQLNERIRQEIPNIDRVSIQYEPHHKTKLRYGIPLSDDKSTISDHFGEAPYFSLVDIDTKSRSMIDQQMIENPFYKEAKTRGIQVAEWLMRSKPDVVITKESMHGKGPGYVFDDYGVKTERTEAKSLQELTRIISLPPSTTASKESQEDDEDNTRDK
jgi:predicted Fe-Mo cluster-binding NifX family protein